MSNVTLTLAHSPDADDLVMWWPILGMVGPDGRRAPGDDAAPALDTGRFRFASVARDVESLNKDAIAGGDCDITAVSAAAYPAIQDRYRVLRCGGSFGEGYGPKVVVRADSPVKCPICLGQHMPRTAVPGTNTTAFLVLSLMLGRRPDCVETPFDRIIRAVCDGEADAGLLIHEGQILFERAGLREVADLGQWWQSEHELPLPLGLSVIRRDLDERFGAGTCAEVAALLARSIRHARRHAESSRRYLLLHTEARPEWADAALVDRYLAMYVSDLSEDMGQRGQTALSALYRAASAAGLCREVTRLDPV